MPYMLSGKALSFANPDPKDVDLVDIAHNLSLICRFNGSCPRHYSVAEHCMIIVDLVDDPEMDTLDVECLKRSALLHDAHEAYTGDVITPIKELMKDGVYKRLCDCIDVAIKKRLLPYPDVYPTPHNFADPTLKRVDEVLLDAEIRAFFPGRVCDKIGYTPPDLTVLNHYASRIHFLTQDEAKKAFLERATELGIREG